MGSFHFRTGDGDEPRTGGSCIAVSAIGEPGADQVLGTSQRIPSLSVLIQLASTVSDLDAVLTPVGQEPTEIGVTPLLSLLPGR